MEILPIPRPVLTFVAWNLNDYMGGPMDSCFYGLESSGITSQQSHRRAPSSPQGLAASVKLEAGLDGLRASVREHCTSGL